MFYDMLAYTKFEAHDLVVDYLGADLGDAHAQILEKGLYVKLKWLKSTIYPKAIREDRFEDAARA